MALSWVLFAILANNAAALRAPGAVQRQNASANGKALAAPFLGKPSMVHDASASLWSMHHEAASNLTFGQSPPCQCEHSNPVWQHTARTSPKCIFIDLGAADGNTFNDFLANKYGPVQNCAYGTGDYEAFLVEANPRFSTTLQSIAVANPKVHALAATAAYMCEGQTSFFLDTKNVDVNYWGSSMSQNHPDVMKSGKQKVTVPTSNLLKLIAENTIPDDYVIVKMDIEGAEWDILPCLADDAIAKRIDRLFLEQHPKEWSMSPPVNDAVGESKVKLQQQGVDIPQYFSNTL